ncbi:hypothetical protein L228DRAFT_269975 [Xylona heveae TC161]|uniref:MARVEL domain-containing protein n=1 Tax=Xylona heveae (strain CBS 132557 / TC161) TaxID=1328760 RepID=A0A165F808_XYLHT|nr:hypothetical protein L228DRAFT_269975 [Xylona heveae TC161]KZF20681.1 hypothetical protein L228DRAFT_269975 [Xylona heveae TC161]
MAVTEHSMILFPLRILQFLFALIVAGTIGYGVHWYNQGASNSPASMNFLLFNCAWTFLIILYAILGPIFLSSLADTTHAYAIFAIDVVTMIFWFAGFIALAVFLGDLDFCIGTVCPDLRAGCVFAAFEWVLFVVSSVISGIRAFRARGAAAPKPATQLNTL